MENPPSLTTMTMTTYVPIDTYSEYMATYTPDETSETGESRYSYSRPNGFGADTLFGRGENVRDTAAFYRDTAAAVTVTTVPQEENTEETEVPSAFSEDAAETVTAAGTSRGFADTAASADRRPRDTMQSREFSRDTMYSTERTEKNTESSTETTAGGAENAN